MCGWHHPRHTHRTPLFIAASEVQKLLKPTNTDRAAKVRSTAGAAVVMSATQQVMVAVLAAFSSEDTEAIGVVVTMLCEQTHAELREVIAQMAGVTLALSESTCGRAQPRPFRSVAPLPDRARRVRRHSDFLNAGRGMATWSRTPPDAVALPPPPVTTTSHPSRTTGVSMTKHEATVTS